MNLPLKRLLSLLAVVAIAWMQLFGIKLGYECDFTGEVRMTQADHCHGWHEHNESENFHSLVEHEEGDRGDVHEHPAITDDLKSSELQQFSIIAPAFLAYAWYSFELQLVDFRAVAQGGIIDAERLRSKMRHWPNRLTHQIVLRV